MKYRANWDTVDEDHDKLRLRRSQRSYPRIYHCTAYPAREAHAPTDEPPGQLLAGEERVHKFNAFLRAGGHYEQITRAHIVALGGRTTIIDYAVAEMQQMVEYRENYA